MVVDEAMDQLEALPDDAQAAVRGELKKLVENPRHLNARAMWGEWAGHWRVRAGVYRIVYQIHRPDRIVVVRIGGRGSVYLFR